MAYMSHKPYVGITGLTTGQEVKDILQLYGAFGYSMETPHIPMLGYLVNDESLYDPGRQPLSRRYPRFKEIAGLLRQGQGCALQVIHYSSARPDLAVQVARLLDGLYETGLCRAVQFNIPWPAVTELQKIKEMYPKLRLILQLSHQSMLAAGGTSPVEIVARVQAYGSAVSDVLIDPSAGRGLAFSLAGSTELAVYQLLSASGDLCLGFAGGFDGDTVSARVQEIIDLTAGSEFSIDVESRVRDRLSEREGDDVLSLHQVRRYLQAAATVLA
jgi:hypothetical protein